MPTDDRLFLPRLEVEVEEELAIAESTHPEDAITESPAEWLFDPIDAEREEVGLRSILGAAEGLETDPRSHRPGDGDPRPDRE